MKTTDHPHKNNAEFKNYRLHCFVANVPIIYKKMFRPLFNKINFTNTVEYQIVKGLLKIIINIQLWHKYLLKLNDLISRTKITFYLYAIYWKTNFILNVHMYTHMHTSKNTK